MGIFTASLELSVLGSDAGGGIFNFDGRSRSVSSAPFPSSTPSFVVSSVPAWPSCSSVLNLGSDDLGLNSTSDGLTSTSSAPSVESVEIKFTVILG